MRSPIRHLTAGSHALAAALLVVASLGRAADGPSPNQLGINLGAPLDWDRTRLYADAMRTARAFAAVDSNGNGARVPADAEGWPRSDFSFYVSAGIDQMHGAYALTFRGQAQVTLVNVGAVPVSYDAATNTSSGSFTVTDTGNFDLVLDFAGTRRMAAAAAGTGVTKVQIMRPLAPGSAQSYPPTALFNEAAKRVLSKFQVARFMDFLATNGNLQREWGDRPLPSWASQQRYVGTNGYGWQGIGGPWEHVVLLANEAGIDPWINIPASASDDYVRKVALLFRYGSDGVNPYTSPQANPVYPPLDSNRRLYVEYSNEVWNGSFSVQHQYNLQQAQAEVQAGGSPLAFDGVVDSGGWTYAWRRVAKRGVEISNVFRGVFGDGQMPLTGSGRIRPVLMTQETNAQGTFYQAARLLQGYYNNGEGNFVATPRPPSYYFYGAGGSGYYGPKNDDPALTLDGIFSGPLSMSMTPAGWAPDLRVDADYATALGLKRVCYEGGPSLDRRSGVNDAPKAAAVDDPRMTGVIVNNHDAWSNHGGELLVYFTAVHDFQWGFTQNLYNLDTAKFRGIDELVAAPRAAVTHGMALPGAIPGGQLAVMSRNWGSPAAGSATFEAGDPNNLLVWGSYTFAATESSQRTLSLSVANGRSGAQVAVYWDGLLLGTQAVGAAATTLSFGNVNVTPGLHGVIVRASSGSFDLAEVRVQ